LWSAAQHALPIAFVIVKNGTYEALNEFGRHFRLSQLPGLELPQLDFCGLAQSQGVHAVSVTSIEKLDDALSAAFRSDAPMLVEVAVEQAP
jgi:benzoylformate decarboxylase